MLCLSEVSLKQVIAIAYDLILEYFLCNFLYIIFRVHDSVKNTSYIKLQREYKIYFSWHFVLNLLQQFGMERCEHVAYYPF